MTTGVRERTPASSLERVEAGLRQLEAQVKALPENKLIQKQFEECWSAIQQLQEFREEDNQQLADVTGEHASLIDQLQEGQQTLLKNLEAIQVELDKAIKRGSLTYSSDSQEGNKELYSFLGIEASKDTWIKILVAIAGTAVIAAGAYFVYRQTQVSRPDRGPIPI